MDAPLEFARRFSIPRRAEGQDHRPLAPKHRGQQRGEVLSPPAWRCYNRQSLSHLSMTSRISKLLGGGQQMRISLSTIISCAVLVIGIIFQKDGLWLPISVAVCSVIYTINSPWVLSGKGGSNALLSEGLRLILNIIGFYATVGQFVCLFWLVRWFIL